MNLIQRFRNFFSKRDYEGAAKGRRTSSWKASGTSADAEIYKSLSALRNRSRDLARNNPYARRAIDVLTNEIVGHGIVATITHPNLKTQEILNQKFKKWAESKDIDFLGRHDLYGLQRLVTQSILESGEILAIEKKLNSKFPTPVAFQIIEPDHLELGDTKKTENGNQIIHSIEFDEQGKRIAYHILKDHPGNYLFFNQREKIRYAAEKVCHAFKTERPGQNRGVPLLSPVLLKLRDIDEFQDAQIVRQKIAACFAVFIKDIEADSQAKDDSNLPEKVEPGIIEHLPPGKDVTFANPPGVENYKEFLSVELHSIASAVGITYESLTNDFSDVNFSSARMGHLQMQRNIDVWRWQVLVPYFLDFVAEKFLNAAELRGINTEGAAFIWTPPRKELIDPTKEIPAIIKAVRAGLMTLGEAVRQGGYQLEEHLKQMSEDNKLIDKYGLFLDTDGRKMTQKGDLQAETEETDDSSPDEDETEDETEDE